MLIVSLLTLFSPCKEGIDMQYNHNTEIQLTDEEILFSPAKKRTQKARMWREIEELEARQKLSKELRDIDQSFAVSLNDLV